MTTKSILHIIVRSDQHGNLPSTAKLNSVKRKFEEAIRKTNSEHAVIVTNELVKVTEIVQR